MADKALRRPVGEADLAAPADHTQHLGRGLFVVRREHHAKSREHGIEAAIGIGQGLDIGDGELDRQMLGLGAGAALVEQFADIVGRGHIGEAAGCREGRIAIACRNVEHFRTGLQVDALAELLADDLQRGADHRIVARRPRRLLARLECGIVDRSVDGGVEGIHLSSSCR